MINMQTVNLLVVEFSVQKGEKKNFIFFIFEKNYQGCMSYNFADNFCYFNEQSVADAYQKVINFFHLSFLRSLLAYTRKSTKHTNYTTAIETSVHGIKQ